MDAVPLIFSLALIGGALVLIFYPVWQQTRPEAIFRVDRSGQTVEEYQARYQAILAAIKDLMFDYEMGKVSAEDYTVLLSKTKLEAASIRRQIDRLSQSARIDIDVGLDAEIETLIVRMKGDNLDGNEALLREVDAEIELLKNIELVEYGSPVDGSTNDGPACPNCGKTVQAGDAFCAHCGQSLPESEAQSGQGACPECGYALQPDDMFCAKCGVALKEVMKRKHEHVATTEPSA